MHIKNIFRNRYKIKQNQLFKTQNDNTEHKLYIFELINNLIHKKIHIFANLISI